MKFTLHNNTTIDLSLQDRYEITISYLRDYVRNIIDMEATENDMIKCVAENKKSEAVEEYIDLVFDDIEEDKDYIISLLFDSDPYDAEVTDNDL